MKLFEFAARKSAEFRSWLRASFKRSRLEAEMETYIRDVRTLVTTIYHLQ